MNTENSSHGYSEGSEVPESPKEEEEKPDYINKEVKNVSEADLKKALHEVKEKNERDSREMRESTNRALSDGFRCGPAKPHNAKRFESGEHAEIVIQSLRDQLAAKEEELARYIAANSILCDSESEVKLTNENNRLEIENRKLKEALKELIPIAECARISVENPEWEEQLREYKSKFERAKELLTPNR